jgi:hypothetical protein
VGRAAAGASAGLNLYHDLETSLTRVLRRDKLGQNWIIRTELRETIGEGRATSMSTFQ